MEILFVSHKYPPATGGMEKQSYELIRGMETLTKVHKIVYEGAESRTMFFMLLPGRIHRILKAQPGISVIHFNDGLMGAFGMMLKLDGIKRSVTLHGLDVVFPGFLYQKVILPRFNRFDLIFAVSRATAIACRERGIVASKIVVVNNGVDTRLQTNAPRAEVNEFLLKAYNVNVASKRILVVMGRAVRRKGFSWIISKVMPKVHPDFTLLLIGPVKPERSVLRRLIPAAIMNRVALFLGAASDEMEIRKLLDNLEIQNVIRLGKLPRKQINAVLGVADAFLMPNIEVDGDMEGFGLVGLEACMRGTFVIASASGGITDAIATGRNGLLLPPGHIASWKHAIDQLLDCPEKRLCSKDILSYTIENFSWSKMVKKYHEHFLTI